MADINHKYQHIINLKRPKLDQYPTMSMINRAAQFGSFSAVVGHEEAINEKGRYTSEELYLDDNQIDELNYKIQLLMIPEYQDKPITITYFVPDLKKEGGSYHQKTG